MTTPLSPIIAHLVDQHSAIENWFSTQWAQVKAPIYTSVDIRDSGFKLSPVDTNLFPAGFNNLALKDRGVAAHAAQQSIQQWAPYCQRILIIAEQHTRNVFYLEHLAYLKAILEAAQFEVMLSTLTDTAYDLITPSGETLHLATLARKANDLSVNGVVPDCILLNNDLSDGLPEILTGLNQPILPSTRLGWHQRYKSSYFEHYNTVCRALTQRLQWDMWLLNPLFLHCDGIDFMTSVGKDTLIESAHTLFARIAEKYNAYNIKEKPYIVIKADSGSYGMGVLTIEHPDELIQLSRKKRSHMSKTKGNRPIRRVLLQEGVHSCLHWADKIAEPVMYLFGTEVVGGFYRTHAARNAKENLNTPGMELIPLQFRDNQFDSDAETHTDYKKQLYAYSVIARLSALAAALEHETLSCIN